MMRDLNLLMIEDSAPDAELILDILQRSGFATTHVRVESEPELRHQLTTGDWEIILSDHGILELNSLRALEVVEEMEITTPVVVVSGTIGEGRARAGALLNEMQAITPHPRRRIEAQSPVAAQLAARRKD